MAKTRTVRRQWIWAPDRRHKPHVPDELKEEVKQEADALVANVLKPKYLKPSPKNPLWNYPIDLWTRWHHSFFYFCATWASPGPNALSPTFELRFARMEYAGERRFNLAYMRHTGQWWEVHKRLPLEKCLELIGEGGMFSVD